VSPPLVSGILPFADPRRLSLVRKAVNNFIRQHYTPYELVVVNGTDTPVLTNREMDSDLYRESGCSVVEVRAPAGLNAAAMRNKGIEIAKGEWNFPIDDDDWCHPERLMFQMAHRREGSPCLLRYQLRVDISSPLTLSAEEPPTGAFKPLLHLLGVEDGISSTLLFPRLTSSGALWLYDENLNTGEHSELLARMRRDGADATVCNNMHNTFVSGMQWPILSIAMFHTSNELTHEQFFPKLSKLVDRTVVPQGLIQSDMAQLRTVLQSYNFKIR
jgi:glycosyltransferase involved in cell wall biosynthesis